MQPELIGGRYRVVRPVGRGGMGTVWLCRDETLERDVAVKQVGLLPGESSTDTARALREARATAALSHRRVVAVHDVVREDGAVWLVMEYVPARTLAQLVADGGPLEPGRVAAIGAQVADGLLAAHRAGLTEVVVPARNEPDLDDLPADVRGSLTVHTLADVADVLALALRPADDTGDIGDIGGRGAPTLAAA